MGRSPGKIGFNAGEFPRTACLQRRKVRHLGPTANFCYFLEMGHDFYDAVLHRLLGEGLLKLDDKVLVTCGGPLDGETLLRLGFRDATITNLDNQQHGSVAPLQWAHQNAECLTYENQAFDVALVHAGLHHCRSPHRALLEMYRVAKKAVVVFEARDSLAMKIARLSGLTPDYEIEAVVTSDNCQYGGV